MSILYNYSKESWIDTKDEDFCQDMTPENPDNCELKFDTQKKFWEWFYRDYSKFSEKTRKVICQIGTKVKHPDTQEVGVVVYTWLDAHGDQDCYIAFFGSEFPEGEPEERPYVLRYYANGLEILHS